MARVKRGIGQMLVLLLLLLYFTGSSSFEFLHSFTHDHNVEVPHSAEQEKDPCHRVIYHADVKDGCGHESHLVVADKCSMCDMACHGDQIILKTFSFKSVIPFQKEPYNFYKANLNSYWGVISSSRAPPALI